MKMQKIFVAGHNGMVGSAIVRKLKQKNFEIITIDRSDLDLINQKEVENLFKNQKIDQVYISAAKVGGIHANNTYPADFIYQNLMIQSNIIHNAFLNGVKKILFLGSSCIYPKNSNQPIKEEELLTGKLELTNEPYAIAKITGIKMCESYNRQFGNSHGIDYRSIMPTNLYGPGDNYHPENSHVIPGLIHRFHTAKIKNFPYISVWGSGTIRREFLFVDDLAHAAFLVMNLDKEIYEKYTSLRNSHINVGSGADISIKDLAVLIKDLVKYDGEIKFDNTKPDGPPRKFLNTNRINKIGFIPKVSLEDGLNIAYQDYLKLNDNP